MAVRLRVPPVDDPDFFAEVDFTTGAVLRLVGSADTIATPELAALLQTLHGELIAKALPEIVVDLRDLDFMAATCVRELVHWIEGARYKIRLRSNPTIVWQRHALPALSCFDTTLVTVEV
jgi:anti-anti-sigma regulatory factor